MEGLGGAPLSAGGIAYWGGGSCPRRGRFFWRVIAIASAIAIVIVIVIVIAISIVIVIVTVIAIRRAVGGGVRGAPTFCWGYCLLGRGGVAPGGADFSGGLLLLLVLLLLLLLLLL